MARTLQEIQADIDAHAAAATPGSHSETIYELMGELARFMDKGQGTPSVDCVEEITRLNNAINDQAKILQATKDALHISDTKTMVQMPEEAATIYADSQKWKATIH